MGIYGWFTDEAVVQLVEEEDQNSQDNDGGYEAQAGVAALAEV